MADPKLDPSIPPGLHLVSAFFAMEPTDSLISIARACGGGLITERMQRFIWDHCISKAIGEGSSHYLKNFIKKLIFEIESSRITVLDELYEQYAYYMTSFKDDLSGKGNSRICKCISFLFPDGWSGPPSFSKSRKLVVPLHCSLNMLEGDTGCAVWPSSLYLSEFVLSFPDIFSNKSCFEVGAGVGLVGICLSHVKASKVVLSDGDLSTLANMKLNLELNHLRADSGMQAGSMQDLNVVKCVHMPWESATKNELQEFMPDIILGADIIYDPSCIPYLIQVLVILLNQAKACPESQTQNDCDDVRINGTDEGEASYTNVNDSDGSKVNQIGYEFDVCRVEGLDNGSSHGGRKKGPVAYIACVIRNIETFCYFLRLAEQANLTVKDITETLRPMDLLPYMQSYNRSSIRLFDIAGK